MSKLNDMYDRLNIVQGRKLPDSASEFRWQLTQEIKDLMLELIDDTESIGTAEYEGRNARILLEPTLRKKVNEL